ncbi:MAG: hypothetical protein ACYC96_07950 [Fimbriimonadaceae bacterium]
MIVISNLVAKLDYPPAWVMMLATLACTGFIFFGGLWFKRTEERVKAQRAAHRAAATTAKNGRPTNP